jgi:sialic acid synthase SpsE
MDNTGNRCAGLGKPAFGKAHGDDETVVCESVSAKPNPMQKMVDGVRNTFQWTGTDQKKMLESEQNSNAK